MEEGRLCLSRVDWEQEHQGVCTAFYESSYNTQALHFENDGSVDFGIFQINSRYWCQYGNELSANECGIQCSDLLSSNLAADAACAKLVVLNSWNGMGAWVSWRLYCQGQDLSRFVEGCGV
nr:lysozyme C II-like isoform X2 [Anolis sagrei ordinatus]